MSMAIQRRNLRVLVCSGNLGNARPDELSFQAWIPSDGNYNEVVQRPVYPLPPEEEQESLYKELGLDHFRVQHGKGGGENGIDLHFANLEEENISDDYFDIIAIGLQEATFDVEEDDPMVLLPVIQPLISKTVFKGLASGVDAMNSMMKSKDHTKVTGMEWLSKGDSKVLGEMLHQHLPSYNFAVRFQRGEMRLEILTHVLLQVETLSVKAQNTGIGMNGVMNAANKGGIVAELLVEGSTRLTFATAHLQAHEGVEKYVDRCRMAAHIFEGTSDTEAQIPLDLSLKSHFTFFLGDLNFRSELQGDYDKEEQMARIRHIVDKEEWRELNKADELFRALRNKDCFMGFQTPPCYFPPTFKVERHSGYVYKENRRPSYTDRILWKTLQKLEENVNCVSYEPIRDFVSSDHKPIRGAFEISLNERIQPRPPLNKKRMSGSTKNLFQLSTKTMGGNSFDALHLFFRDIKCGIKKRSFAPDPYVSFLSFPCHLVQVGETKWQKIKGKLKMGANLRLETQSSSDGSKTRTVQGFPRTKKMKSTYTPEWNEDIHLVVKTHDSKGKPFDMTGAILMITVLDHTPSVESKVIGSIPLNLAALCMSTKEEREGMEATNWHDSFGRVVGERKEDENGEVSDVRTLNMKQPLLRNGRQTGWISLSIDMWWLDVKYQDSKHVGTSDLKKHLMLQNAEKAKATKKKTTETEETRTRHE